MPRKKRKIQAGIPAGYRDGRGKGPIGKLKFLFCFYV